MLIRTTVLSVGAAVMLAGTAHAQAVGIGTGPAASLTNRIGSAIAKVIADGFQRLTHGEIVVETEVVEVTRTGPIEKLVWAPTKDPENER